MENSFLPFKVSVTGEMRIMLLNIVRKIKIFPNNIRSNPRNRYDYTILIDKNMEKTMSCISPHYSNTKIINKSIVIFH